MIKSENKNELDSLLRGPYYTVEVRRKGNSAKVEVKGNEKYELVNIKRLKLFFEWKGGMSS